MRLAGLLLAACGASSTATAPVARPPGPPKPVAPAVDPDPIAAARVDGVSILTWDVDRHMPAETREKIAHTTEPSARVALRTKERRRVLAGMIDRQLLLAAAMALEITATSDEIDAALKEIRTMNNLTEAQLVDTIAASGFGSLEDYRKEIGEQLQVLRYIRHVAPPAEASDAATKRITAELRAKARIAIALPEVPVVQVGFGASKLVTTDDLATVLHHAMPKFETGPLEEDSSTATYDSWHFRAVDEPETADFAVRVWREPLKALQARWDELHAQLPDVHDETGLADATFRASGDNVFGRVYLDRKASLLVMVTCGSLLCPSPDLVLALAQLVHERQARLTR
jgi:hypothetical protein